MSKPKVSVVAPTFKEAKNIQELIRRVSESFDDDPTLIEIIVVDDNSPDGTADAARAMMDKYNVKVFVRTGERGLATAVIHGWQHAEGEYLAVIDADLQHPPDIIRRLYDAAVQEEADMAIASRRVEGGGTKDWELHRVIISQTATYIAQILIPFTLRGVKDATTGCFLFKNGNVKLEKLSPIGFKIFLEVLMHGSFKKRVEVPYVFNQRTLGESKLTSKQNILYLIHLLKIGLKTGEIVIPLAAFAAIVFLLLKVL